jgi:transposase-like protein
MLKAVEAGRAVKDVCREHEVSEATYYKLLLENRALKDVIAKKL